MVKLFKNEELIREEHYKLDVPPKLSPQQVLDLMIEQGFPYASISDPTQKDEVFNKFKTLFGRDSLIICLDLIEWYPDIAKHTLVALAKLQGHEFNKKRNEEQGKILHEHRFDKDPIKQKGIKRGWEYPYYGTVDATSLFLIVLQKYYDIDPSIMETNYTHNSTNENRTLKDAYDLALLWKVKRLRKQPLLEYIKVNPKGLPNQCWKDSAEAYSLPDGTLLDTSITYTASVEEQALTYEALSGAIHLFEVWHKDTEELIQLQNKLGKLVDELFWNDSYYVLGNYRIEQEYKKIKTKTSNMGWLLNTDMPLQHEKELVAELFTKDLNCPSGIRTLSKNSPRFRPETYHNGSVWPFDNYQIAKGLRRRGYEKQAHQIEDKILNIVRTTSCYPEFVMGDDQEPHLSTNWIDVKDKTSGTTYRAASTPQRYQGWTISAVVAILKSRNLAIDKPL